MIERTSDMVFATATAQPESTALRHNAASLTYGSLAAEVTRFGAALTRLGLLRYERVAILSGKCFENAIAIFGTAAAGGAFVPVNTLLKPEQVAYILADCEVSVLVTTANRLEPLLPVLGACPSLRHVVLVDGDAPATQGVSVLSWAELMDGNGAMPDAKVIGSDMASIMYTSGSTGKPKGVVLSHTNLLVGAASVASYIGNSPADIILAALPFSFDAGLSQLMSGIYSGASIVLQDYFLPSDVVRIVKQEGVTGITGVPPLWIQLAEQNWPDGSTETLRYFANTGGKMPRTTLDRLRKIFPQATPFLMYGLTESFRSTYLPPEEVDRRPDSIGKAIPNAEVLVVAEDGAPCGPDEVGELVHRGPLVSLGYWNDSDRTAERFRPPPGLPAEIPTTELAVWSGDFVRKDDEGFLYFVGRRDDMIKTSGYRVSPAEVEEVAYSSGLVSEVAALGLPDDRLGQIIVLIAKAADDSAGEPEPLLAHIRKHLPNYMLPSHILWRDELPRNSNGKMDRPRMIEEAEKTLSPGGVQ